MTSTSYTLAGALPKAKPPLTAELERDVLHLRAALEAAQEALDRLDLATQQTDARDVTPEL